MKKEKRTTKPVDKIPLTEGPEENDALIKEGKEEGSIEDFIELKKLQNRILGKMIENINKPKTNNKSKSK